MRRFVLRDIDKEHSRILAKVKYYTLEVITTLAIDAEASCINCRFEDVVEFTYKNLLNMYKQLKNLDNFDKVIINNLRTALKNVVDPDEDTTIFKKEHGRTEMSTIVEALYETLEYIDSEYFYSVQ